MGAAELVELLKTTEFVVGLLVSVTTALVTLVVWFHRRMRDVATEVNDEARGPREEMAKRLGELEQDMRDTRGEVHALAGRVGGVERTLETVARQKDLALLGAQMGEFRGAVSAELRVITGQIDTLYKAALRSSNRAEK